MAEGNGIDLGSIFGLLLQLQEQMKALRTELRAEMQAQGAEFRAEMHAQGAELRGEMQAQGDDLRRTIDAYHGSVMGHGILITELPDRVTRVEYHLGLPLVVHG